MLRPRTLNNRPLMLAATAMLAWCLLLCPSLSLAMQTPPANDHEPTQAEPASGGCHPAVHQAASDAGQGDCDHCQTTDQIPGGLVAPDSAPATPFFNLLRVTSRLSALLTAAPSLPPDAPPLFLLEEVFLI